MADDPRKGTNFPTVNEAILSDSVRHRLGLDQLSGSIRNSVVSLLNESDSDIERILENRLEAGLSPGASRPQFLGRLRRELEDINNEIFGEVDGKLKSELRDVATSEADHSVGMVNKHTPAPVSMTRPPDSLLVSIVDSEPFEGRVLGEWTEATARDRLDKIENAVRLGLVEGDSTDEIVQRVVGSGVRGRRDGALQASRKNIAAVTRTAVTHVTSNAREITYQQNRRVIKGVQIVATLDFRTTLVCQSEDGNVYPVGRGPRPGFHFACRTTSSPLTRSWREMGIDRDELDPSTRASMNGEEPETMNYEDWLRDNPSRADEALGKTRAELWRTGEIDLEDMVRGSGKPINLDQLREREADVFEAAGL